MNGARLPVPSPCLGSCPEKPRPPRQDSPAPPGLRGGAASGWSAAWCPTRPSPSAPTAPTRRRLTGGGRSSALTRPGDSATWKHRFAKRARGALHCPCSKAAHSPARTLSSLSAAASPARSARRLLSASAPAAARAGRMPLLELLPPRPSPGSAAGSGPDLK